MSKHLKKLEGYCRVPGTFAKEGFMSIYEMVSALFDKSNETVDFVNEFEDDIESLEQRKENKSQITLQRKLSPLGDFTGSIRGKQSLQVLSEIDDNRDKNQYVISQLRDGQNGLVVDGGFFEDEGIRKNYDGGTF